LRPIVFVEQFYYPDGWGGTELPLTVTMALATTGSQVEVVCGSDQYAPLHGDPGPDPRSRGVRITRIPALMGGRIHDRKLVRQLWFSLCLLPCLIFRRRPRSLISQTNPPLAVLITSLAARLWRCPLIIIAMDVYPEVLIAHGTVRASSLFARLLRRLFAWSYRSADRIVSLGPVMTRRLEAKTNKKHGIVEISNWATGPLAMVRTSSLSESLGLPGGIRLLYSGNLGIGHEFDTLLAGFAKALEAEPSISLVIVGAGKRLPEVRQAVAALRVGHAVRFIDLVPAARLPESMGLADVGLVTLRQGFEGLMVPSKLFGYLGRGIPVLYVGPPSDIDFYIARSGGGVSIRNGDANGVADAIQRFQSDPTWRVALGRAGSSYSQLEGSAEHCLRSYLELVRDVHRTAELKGIP
jgi:glycosyltransferase involved in cell wall biosynthesis